MPAYRGRPNRGGEVGVVFEAGDDVPVQVGNDVAQAGEVDIGGGGPAAHRGFDFIRRFPDFRAERSVISATWRRQMTRQKAGAPASSCTAMTRRLAVCSRMCSFCAWQMGQVIGFSEDVWNRPILSQKTVRIILILSHQARAECRRRFQTAFDAVSDERPVWIRRRVIKTAPPLGWPIRPLFRFPDVRHGL